VTSACPVQYSSASPVPHAWDPYHTRF
jgi:hypothetical protein